MHTAARSCLSLLFYLSTYSISLFFSFFFFNDTATTEIYTLSLHDALPISAAVGHPELHTVQDVPVAAPHRLRRDRGRVGAGARLREGKGRGDLARREARQIPPLLTLAAGRHDGPTAGVLHEVDDGGGGARPRDLLDGEAEG